MCQFILYINPLPEGFSHFGVRIPLPIRPTFWGDYLPLLTFTRPLSSTSALIRKDTKFTRDPYDSAKILWKNWAEPNMFQGSRHFPPSKKIYKNTSTSSIRSNLALHQPSLTLRMSSFPLDFHHKMHIISPISGCPLTHPSFRAPGANSEGWKIQPRQDIRPIDWSYIITPINGPK